ncbi:MAG TPA: exodeoxyribonuclease VII large subunit [Parachlamydiaceae bacterium]|nr:exodeoxyribonuclease VII large subunit [Parachlamydiaceae bacterium]
MTSATPEDHPILTVSQLSNAIKHCLEKTFPLVWLQGEISNCKQHTSGHLYFSLKDANAQITAVMFRPDVQALKTIPKDGTQVIVKGEINVYPISGKYQIVVREMRQVGLGELLLKLEELKVKLHKMGWFRSDRKKPLPKFPKKIGVVTSPTGAAIQDMLNILTRRYSGFHLILNPVRVQGEGSAQEIAKAIEQFNLHELVDVMIIGRGGGSIEDLWAFNEEIVAQAIFNSRIPIISAVGHETDHCIADYVADLRAPTPSAAAEIVIAEMSQQLTHLAQIKKRLQQTVYQLIRQDRHRLVGLMRHPALQTPYGILGPWLQRLDTLLQNSDDTMKQTLISKRLQLESKQQLLYTLNPKLRLAAFKEKLANFDKEIKAALRRQIQTLRVQLLRSSETLARTWQFGFSAKQALLQPIQRLKQLDAMFLRLISQKQERFLNIKNTLDSINPKNLLTKGYCILFSEKDNSIITNIQSVKKQQKVQIQLIDGKLQATVNEIIPK